MSIEINIDDTGIPHGVRHIAEQLPNISTLNPDDEFLADLLGNFSVQVPGQISV